MKQIAHGMLHRIFHSFPCTFEIWLQCTNVDRNSSLHEPKKIHIYLRFLIVKTWDDAFRCRIIKDCARAEVKTAANTVMKSFINGYHPITIIYFMWPTSCWQMSTFNYMLRTLRVVKRTSGFFFKLINWHWECLGASAKCPIHILNFL